MERRPKPPEPAPEGAAPGDASPGDASPAALGVAPVSADPVSEAADASDAPRTAETEAEPAEKLTPVALGEAPVAPTDAIEIAMAEIAASLQAAGATAISAAGGDGEASTGEATTPSNGSGAPAATAEDALMEVWRPGRREDRGVPRGRTRVKRREHGRAATPSGPEPLAAAAPDLQSGAVSPEVSAPPPSVGDAAGERRREHRRRRGGGDERTREDRRPEDRRREDRRRDDRPKDDHERREGYRGKPRRERGDTAPRSFGAPRERREKMPDPDSPFAKLAALKEQLEANAKERR